jgi:sec-independent protein translocase protein TatB
MLSIPHMIVVFLVVLVIFGPQKLPELARGLGKLMAEFRKASTDFKSAFEEEMRDLERQARESERRKAETAAVAAQNPPATLATPAGTETQEPEPQTNTWLSEAPMIAPVAEAVPRSSERAPAVPTEAKPETPAATPANDTVHDTQQPA